MSQEQVVVQEQMKETIDLPSKGWFYPPTSPLAKGSIELYYMTAKHEDILTSRNLIKKGIAIDKLLESLIVDKSIRFDDLLLGDKNGIMIAARIMGYGSDYEVSIQCPDCNKKNEMNISLQDIPEKNVDFSSFSRGQNKFTFELPHSKKNITFKFLTHKDEKDAEHEIESMNSSLRSDVSKEVTTRLRYSILAVDGDSNGEAIRKFIDSMLSRDAMAFREHIKKVNPDIDMTFDFTCKKCGYESRLEVPVDVSFFWPHARV